MKHHRIRVGIVYGVTAAILCGSCSSTAGVPSREPAPAAPPSDSAPAKLVSTSSPPAGSTSVDRPLEQDLSAHDEPQDLLPVRVPPGQEPMAYDESIPETVVDAYWYMKDDLEELSRTSALVFTGRVTGYVERIKVLPSAAEVPGEDRGFDVYDGVVFSVDELLLGDLAPDENTVTVAVRRLFLNADGSPRYRLSPSPIETVEPGITARDSSDGPTYIVFVTEDRETYSPFYESGYYHFNTPGGVAPMLDSDKIGVAAGRPLARPVVTESGVSRTIDHGLTLDSARTVTQVLEAEAGPGEWVPVGPFDVMDPDELGPVGTTGE